MKNNKGLVIMTIILGVLVVVLGGYIVYDNFVLQDNNVQNDTNKNQENDNTLNNEVSTEKENADEVNNDSNDNNSVICEECDYCEYTEIDYSDLFDMGSGNIIGSASSYNEDGIKLNLYSNGKLYYVKKKETISAQKEIQISNIVKVVAYSNSGSGTGTTFYMLNKDGQLYNIDESAIINGNVTPKIVSNVAKFVDIGIWNTFKPNAGGGEGVFGITADGKAHSVIFNSV